MDALHILIELALSSLDALAADIPTIDDALQHVGRGLDGTIGDGTFGGIATIVGRTAIAIIDIVAVLMITRAGIGLMLEQKDEEFLGVTRRIVATAFIAIVLLILSPMIRDALYNYETSAKTIISTETLGLIQFLEVGVGAAIVLIVVFYGIRSIITFGSEDGIDYLRKMLMSILAGMVLIVFKSFITESVVTGDPTGIITTITTVMNVLISFAALLAVGVVVYAGYLLITAINDDERATKARDILIRVAIGFIIILASYAIVNLLMVL